MQTTGGLQRGCDANRNYCEGGKRKMNKKQFLLTDLTEAKAMEGYRIEYKK